jgi:hypothetical protein
MRTRAPWVVASLATAIVACQQSASPSPSPSTASAEPTAAESSGEPSAMPTPIGSALTTFGSGPGPAMARDVAAFDDGFVAVGVQYADSLPNLGLLPEHEGRIWRSADGAAWEDVTPSGELGNVDLSEVFVGSDGMLVTLGGVSQIVPGGTELFSLGAWESADGETWQPIAQPVPGLKVNVETGAVGYIALAYAQPDNDAPTAWFSSDGAAWTQVFQLPDGVFDLDAGDQGFVILGEAYTVASGDGQQWVPATNVLNSAPTVAALAGDWVSVPQSCCGPTATAWFSADGLSWAQSGTIPMAQVQPDPQVTCMEYPTGLVSTSAIFLSTTLAGCSEGAFVVHGTVFWSSDGASWTALPFPAGQVGVSQSGSRVDGAAENDDVLVLAGQLDRQAALWTNPLD